MRRHPGFVVLGGIVVEQSRRFDLGHRVLGEFRAGRVARDYEHQHRMLLLGSVGDVFETPNRARRERDHIQGIEVGVFDLSVLVFPARTPLPVMAIKVSLVSWLCIIGPLPGKASQ